MLSTGPLFRSAVGRWLQASGDASLRAGIVETLESIRVSNGYVNVFLAGTDGKSCFRSLSG